MANTSIELKIPNLGESITEATLTAWLKADGATVDANDAVAELETEKATVELPAGASGVLRIVAAKGQTVQVGDVVARIEGSGARGQGPEGEKPEVSSQKAEVRSQKSEVSGQKPEVSSQKAEVRSRTPEVSSQPSAQPLTPDPSSEERVEMSKLRQTIARRLVEAQHATASLTTFNEIDMSTVIGLREKYKEAFEKKYGVGLGYVSFFAKAVCAAIHEVPAVNAMIDGTAIVYRKYVHLGIAVSTPRGLMVPVVRHAEQLSMAELEGEIKRLATKAREGKISVDEMAGGTFTITNGGVFGSMLSTPILNPPQAGILGMHKIAKRAVVIDDGIAVRPMMYVALTYDHRVIDGQQSVTFLVKVREMLEDPARIVIEV